MLHATCTIPSCRVYKGYKLLKIPLYHTTPIIHDNGPVALIIHDNGSVAPITHNNGPIAPIT